MRFLSLAVLSGAVLSGCVGDSFLAPPPPPPSLPLFTIQGVVRDQSGHPVSGATVFVIGNPLSTETDDAGRYQIHGVGGQITLGVQKPGHLVVFVTVFVASETTLDILFQQFALSDSLVVGETVTIVDGWGPPCDPLRWDGTAPCRRLYFTPSVDGMLSLALTWNGAAGALDMVLVTELGDYVAIALEPEPGVVHLEVPVVGGERYQVRVNAYYSPQTFNLWSAFAPEP